MQVMSSAQLEQLARSQDAAGLDMLADHTLSIAREQRAREDDAMLSIPRHQRNDAPPYVGPHRLPSDPVTGAWVQAHTIQHGQFVSVDDELWSVAAILTSREEQELSFVLDNGLTTRAESFSRKALLWCEPSA